MRRPWPTRGCCAMEKKKTSRKYVFRDSGEGAFAVISFVIRIWFSVLCDAMLSMFRMVQAW